MTGYCESHTALIYDRGGRNRLWALNDITKIEYNRGRDKISEGSVVISGASCSKQRDVLSQIQSKRHELVIFRGRERVWEGPIFRISDEVDTVSLFAKDIMAYLEATPLSKVWDNRFVYETQDGITTVTDRLDQIVRYELVTSRTGRTLGGNTVNIPGWETLDPPINVLPYFEVHHFPNEARTTALTEAFETTVGEHIENMARSAGVDYTVVGRALHIWDTSRSLGRLRTFTEKDFLGPVIVTEYGADHNQGSYVLGQDGIYGEAINPSGLAYYGPWLDVDGAYNEGADNDEAEAPTKGALNSQAARNTSGRSPVPVEVRVPDNSSVRLGPTLSLNDLVPGVQIPLVATLNARARAQLQKLDSVKVTEQSGKEDIQITLVPATKEDSDEEDDD